MSYVLDRLNLESLQLTADLFGRPRQVSSYRWSTRTSAGFRDLDEATEPSPDEPCPEATRAWLREQISGVLNRYQSGGNFSEIELRTIRALWLDGLSLRQFAKSEGVTAEAVRARIEGNRKGQGGIKRKAPQFYRWWAFKQRRRRKGPHVA